MGGTNPEELLRSAQPALGDRQARLADAEALIPRDAGLIDAAERRIRVVVMDDVLALLERRTVAGAVPYRGRGRGGGVHGP